MSMSKLLNVLRRTHARTRERFEIFRRPAGAGRTRQASARLKLLCATDIDVRENVERKSKPLAGATQRRSGATRK